MEHENANNRVSSREQKSWWIFKASTSTVALYMIGYIFISCIRAWSILLHQGLIDLWSIGPMYTIIVRLSSQLPMFIFKTQGILQMSKDPGMLIIIKVRVCYRFKMAERYWISSSHRSGINLIFSRHIAIRLSGYISTFPLFKKISSVWHFLKCLEGKRKSLKEHHQSHPCSKLRKVASRKSRRNVKPFAQRQKCLLISSQLFTFYEQICPENQNSFYLCTNGFTRCLDFRNTTFRRVIDLNWTTIHIVSLSKWLMYLYPFDISRIIQRNVIIVYLT